MGETVRRATGTAPVESVNSKIGAVILNKTDIGLSNVPNVDASNRANHFGGVGIALQKWSDPNGDDTTGDGSRYTPFRTIQKAIDESINGTTINCGNMTEQLVTIDGKSVRLISTGNGTIINKLRLINGANANMFKNIRFDNFGSELIENTIDINQSSGNFFGCTIIPNDVSESVAFHLDNGSGAQLWDCNVEEGNEPEQTLSILAEGTSSVAVFASVVDTIDTTAGSNFFLGGGTIWNREDSVIDGNEFLGEDLEDTNLLTTKDVEVTNSARGVILKGSPNSNRYRITIDDTIPANPTIVLTSL